MTHLATRYRRSKTPKRLFTAVSSECEHFAWKWCSSAVGKKVLGSFDMESTCSLCGNRPICHLSSAGNPTSCHHQAPQRGWCVCGDGQCLPNIASYLTDRKLHFVWFGPKNFLPLDHEVYQWPFVIVGKPFAVGCKPSTNQTDSAMRHSDLWVVSSQKIHAGTIVGQQVVKLGSGNSTES